MMTCSSLRRSQEASPPPSDSSVVFTLKSSSSIILDNGMLTPPEECLNRRVAFDIVDSSESEPEYVDSSHQTSTSSPPPSSASLSSSAQSLLDLCGTRVPQEILVGLFDRASEMRELVVRNSGFFGILRGFVNRVDGEWQKFLDWIFIERDVVGDLEWIEGVGAFLGACPSYFEKFKEIVGFDEDISGEDEDNDEDQDRDLHDEDDDGYYNTNDDNHRKNHSRNRGRNGDSHGESDSDSDSDSDGNDDSDGDNSGFVFGKEDGYDADNADDSDEERPYDANFEAVDLTLIRRFPARLASFERSYPQFFINVRDCLCRPRGPHGIATSCPSRVPVESKSVNPSGRVEQIACTEEEVERPYDEFIKVLFSSERVMPNEEWERTLLECLEGWPNLLAQLKEIVAFEVEDSWEEE